MKIYTKKGDKGKTQLLGGKNVTKFHPRVTSYGNIDELNAYIGHIYDQEINNNHKKVLKFIQIQLLNLGSSIANVDKSKNIETPKINEKEVIYLEEIIDEIDEKLSPLTQFILPCGHSQSSLCHIARTVCRRAERSVVKLAQMEEIGEYDIIFLNRLSDYLFVLARILLNENNKTEIYWK
ncbi:MAG: ATP:cob(I)alamin adenosyltransferase [Flavobacteriales bacterium]|nr:ATP:cob(I)alamin adenosyltransferase [Flavobacteriales bacterium]|tara:strand:- start:274 stop:813 length:540 start_codon:yes stop_codon:yes gene_type:complete